MKRLLSLWLVACSSALPAAPNDSGASDSSAPATDAGADATSDVWSPCDLVPKSGEADAQCATIAVPKDWANPSAGDISLGLKRVAGTKAPKAQLWLVDGGPGGSAVNAFTYIARSVLSLRPDIAVYAIDHRGVGGSHPLECPQQQKPGSPSGWAITEAEYPPCIAHLESTEGDVLPWLTTSQSARDLAAMIDRMRLPSTPVFVWGGSYGTYMSLRFMKLFPKKVDGVILEGIDPPARTFDDYDVEMDGAAKLIFDECAKDATCTARLGPDPWKTAHDVIASFDQGQCATLGLDADNARAFLGSELFFSPIRDLLPMVVYRMQRCAPKDVTAIVKFYQRSTAIWGSEPRGMQLNDGHRTTDPLFFHVALSEMWHRGGNAPDPTTALTDWRKLTMSTGLTVRIARREAMKWPVYPRGAEVTGELPAYDGPILMLQGTFDAATTFGPASTLRDFYKGPRQTFVAFPRGSHQIVGATPTTQGGDCGENVALQFLDDPSKAIDTSCTNDLPPLLLSGNAQLNTYFFGVSDGWDG